ncbi:MAG: hypothetical protein OXQ32_10535 [bacterium]|nr:hypothetical protein [bacterium]
MTLVSSRTERNRTAAIYTLVSVVGISVLPLVVVMVGAPESPLLFGAFLSVGTSAGSLAFLAGRYRAQLRNREILALIKKNLASWPILFVLVGTFEFTFFAWSTRFVDPSVATILWGSWPIIFVFLLRRIFSGKRAQANRYKKITPSLVLLMVLSLVGLAFVVLAQASKQTGFDWTSDSSWVGFVFAVFSGVLITLNIFSFSWAADLASKARTLNFARGPRSMELFFMTVVVCVSNAFTAPIKAGFSLAASEPIQTDVILGALIMGGTLRVGSSLLWRHANQITHALGINAIGYGEPLFGVLWLALFWEVDISRVDYLVLGTCAIIASNILINSEVEISRGFKSAILAMWATGAIVYLRDDGPLWGSGRFFGVLALLAGAFALLQALRSTASPPPAGRHALDRPLPSEAAPRRARSPLITDRLNLARTFTMGLYGAVAIALTIIVRPAVTGWVGLAVEVFAVSFCTAIAASAFYTGGWPGVVGRRPERAVGTELPGEAYAGWEQRERRIANWTNAAVATGTYLSFLYLLWDKWLN